MIKVILVKLNCLENAFPQFNKTIQKKLLIMVVKKDAVLRTGADESEVDGFVNYCLSIKGVKIGLLFFEMNDGIKLALDPKELYQFTF